MNRLSETKVEQTEERLPTVGFYAGAFKPPHKGHVYTALQAANRCDDLVIVVSEGSRDRIDNDKSIAIWNIYAEYLRAATGCNIRIGTVQVPVRAVYENIAELNAMDPSDPEGGHIDVIVVYGGDDDDGCRYQALHDNKNNMYSGNTVKKIQTVSVERMTSSTAVRESLSFKEDVTKYLPEFIDDSDRQKIVDILNNK